jgi:3,4-dihydroxy 2-butanone 4-phosphate synthase / GTP cyclohydrolase II
VETIEQALVELAAGRPVVVVDGEDRENEGDLIVAADRVTAATMAFLVRHTSGYVCVALPATECERLCLPPAHHSNADGFGTAYRVSVDAAGGITTGISGRDRAYTARLLTAASTAPADLTRPGHVVPLAARPGGVLERAGHTEAAVDLTRLAGLRPGGVLCEIVSTREHGRMARRPELVDFAADHGLAMISIEDLASYRRTTETTVERLAGAQLPTDHGCGRLVGYRAHPDESEHLAFVVGDPREAHVPVHIHTECVLGDVFGSRSCDCAHRLDASLDSVVDAGLGVVVYLRPPATRPVAGQLGRGGRPATMPGGQCAAGDDVAVVAEILADLGVRSVEHLHNTPTTADGLDAVFGSPSGVARPDPVGGAGAAVA